MSIKGSVRTTVTLDHDVQRRATEFSKARGLSFREGLNELVRAGLIAQSQPVGEKPFCIKPRNFGLKPGLNYDNIEELLEVAEDIQHR